jgi:hypothetical protein
MRQMYYFTERTDKRQGRYSILQQNIKNTAEMHNFTKNKEAHALFHEKPRKNTR